MPGAASESMRTVRHVADALPDCAYTTVLTVLGPPRPARCPVVLLVLAGAVTALPWLALLLPPAR